MKLKPLTYILLFVSFLSCETSEIDLYDEQVIEDSYIEEIVSIDPIEEEEEEEFDEVYNWIVQMQLPNGLLESSENSNFVSLYDNALAALVFISKGEYEKAERIFDFFNSKIDAELLHGNGGFYQFRDKHGENGRRTWMGDNVWLLISLNKYHQATNSRKYGYMAKELDIWIRSLQDTDGGLWGGHNVDGSRIHKITEGIVTAFSAIEGYDDFHMGILNYLKENRWSPNEKLIVAWPENPAYNHAMDLHSLAYTILEDFPNSALDNANRYLNTQIATVSGEEVTGYCFDEDRDVIWLEGTAQMATAYNKSGIEAQADHFLKELEKTFIKSTSLENSKGIPYATNQGSSFGASLLWDHADTTPAMSSTAWYLFAKSGYNPLNGVKSKNIPAEDKFWTNEFEN